MIRSTALSALLAIACMASQSAAAAEPSHFYAGVSVGQSSVDGPSHADQNISFGPTLPTTLSIDRLPLDDHDTAWSAFVGYEATRYLGVELGYADHGKFERRTFGGNVLVSLGIKELYFGTTLRYPLLERLSLTGSAGISRARFDVSGEIPVFIATRPPGSTLPPGAIIGLPPGLILPPGTIFPPGAIIGLFPTEPTVLTFTSPDDETGGYWSVGASLRVTDRIETNLSYGRRYLHVQDVSSVGLSLLYSF